MRIAYYNHTSSVSGAEINLLVTAAHYKRAEVTIMAPEGDLLERAREAGLLVVALPSYNARLSRNPLRLAAGILGMIRAGKQLSDAVMAGGAEVIHANSLRAGMMASLFYWRHRIPVVWHLHDNPPKGLVGKLIRMYAAKAAQAFIAISEPVMKGFGSSSGTVHLIHNGAVLSPFSELEKKRYRIDLRRQLDTPAGGRVMVIIGQIAPWKRQEDAIRALHSLIQQGEENYLWIVGEPKFREENLHYLKELQRLADELNVTRHIRFTGFRNDVDQLCCAADLLLLCSENEPFGRVIIEAMAQGTPVIATSGGGVGEIIEHGKSGLLYETGNIPQLVDHIRSLQSNDRLRKQISVNCVERVGGYFSIEQAAAKTEHVYAQLVRESAGRNNRLEQTKGVAK
ncbi:glycosyltransferase family 4 protein [Paenibacillus sp. BK720]|uniref:glycosyltransferase family 4 protein n=1 Tax=Paenibacillus sp. BK720 TaxID=2587092 RepID=UPI001420EDB7|nr:glycosyltransferase family 4 protein [Paenibacillus sp. BK720]NIK66662.1 glycosyltransferase involved in cell wall biosynthesis [Paenibacillus sp. BK720]